jgi:hypothetical protein
MFSVLPGRGEKERRGTQKSNFGEKIYFTR